MADTRTTNMTQETAMAKAKTADTADVKKTKCPITRDQFAKKAPVLTIAVNNGEGVVGMMSCAPKEFSTGSIGWGANEKLTVMVDGVPVKVQVTFNLTIVGSKELDK